MSHGGRVILPCDYVKAHVQLLYATTAQTTFYVATHDLPFDDDARVDQVRYDPRSYAAREVLLNMSGVATLHATWQHAVHEVCDQQEVPVGDQASQRRTAHNRPAAGGFRRWEGHALQHHGTGPLAEMTKVTGGKAWNNR